MRNQNCIHFNLAVSDLIDILSSSPKMSVAAGWSQPRYYALILFALWRATCEKNIENLLFHLQTEKFCIKHFLVV
jgi:hypothetical protein